MARSRTHAAWLVGLLTASLAVASTASATDCDPDNRLSTCVDADTLWPHAGPQRFVGVGGADTTAPRQLAFGLASSWAHRPIVLRSPSSGSSGGDVAAVDALWNTTFLWAFGLTNRLEVDAAVPFTFHQTGSGVSAFTSTKSVDLPRTAARDVRLGLTWAALPRPRRAHADGLSVAVRADASAPAGNADAFAGDRGWGFAPSAAAEWRRGRYYAGAELGARARLTTDLVGTRVGSQLAGGAGFGAELLGEALAVQAEARALYTLAEQRTASRDATTSEVVETSSSRKLVPAEWLASVRSAPLAGGDLGFYAGFGTALGDSPTAAAWRATLGVRYAPLARDTDDDGVLDRDDKCPEEREDRDGFQDADGCPDPDNDGDGIPDAKDRCRDEAETVDGFQDDDGCPDLDDDGDGIPDTADACRMAPEDKDGFEDEDGCPDPDNDRDGIPDAQDRCPNAAEDVDGYLDEDGCPDPDDDQDGVLDAQDLCPREPEDKDGFQDQDGCPDPDDDQDGVADAADKCPREAETIDGVADEDGCPEPGAHDRVRWQGDAIVLDVPPRFAAGSAKVTPQLASALAMVAQRARGRAPLGRVLVETWADRPGDTDANTGLAAKRADAVRAELARSLPADKITAVVGDLTLRRAPGAPSFEVRVTSAGKR